MRTKKIKKYKIRNRVLLKKREKRRLARLDVSYNEYKGVDTYGTRKLVRYSPYRPTSHEKRTIVFPDVMDFCRNPLVTLATLRKIRDEVIEGGCAHIVLDHAKLSHMSPDCAVVLLAEIQRSFQYRHKTKLVQGTHPENEAVKQMLVDIGYYHALGVSAPMPRSSRSSRAYFRVVSGNLAIGKVANEMIQRFESVVKFPGIVRRRLYAGLIECMDNVHAHAYIRGQDVPVFKGHWWIAGFVDTVSKQVAFVFYDQGLGIPETLSPKRSTRNKAFLNMAPEKMIKEAVIYGKSREDSDRHGSGLPSLREVIDLSEVDGFLRVMSGKGDFLYRKSGKAEAESLNEALSGTLISWSLHSYETGVVTQLRDLSEVSGEQLRLSV